MEAYHLKIKEKDRAGLEHSQHTIYIPKDMLVGIEYHGDNRGTLVRTTRYESAQSLVAGAKGVEGKIIEEIGIDPETYDLLSNVPNGQGIIIKGGFDGSTVRLLEILSGAYQLDSPKKKEEGWLGGLVKIMRDKLSI
ncbi:MAG TPA: hypothetical protein VJI46_04415 [Candidatus Nanoarchaeia archaeon]|nr:hypothetical protein [Candidatus Nanoarchaeia archaeon]